MRIGCHVSIRHGFYAAAQTAKAIGCGIFQYFPKNPRSLSVKSFDVRDAFRCQEYCKTHQLLSVAHTPYTVNLATGDPQLQEATIKSLLNDLWIAEECGSIGVVVHFGKFPGNDPLQGYRNIIQLLNEVLSGWQGKAMLLIENQAAGMGTTLQELVQIRMLVDRPERIGFCFDTCHAFAGGMWDGTNWAQVEQLGRELDYSAHLKVVHLNDSKYPYASNKDFHENIGRGCIGAEGFREFLLSPMIKNVPLLLETPTSADYPVSQEMLYVKQLVNN
jgi:deoxyribonuclease-4